MTFTLTTNVQEGSRTNTLLITETFTPTALGTKLGHLTRTYTESISFEIIDSCKDVLINLNGGHDFLDLEVEVLESAT